MIKLPCEKFQAKIPISKFGNPGLFSYSCQLELPKQTQFTRCVNIHFKHGGKIAGFCVKVNFRFHFQLFSLSDRGPYAGPGYFT